MIAVVALTYYDLDTFEEKTELYGTEGFTTTASDTPARTPVPPLLETVPTMRKDAFDEGKTKGDSSVGYGELSLQNTDGELYAFRRRTVDGRDLKLYLSDDKGAAFPSGWEELFTCTMEQIEITQQSVKIRIRDKSSFADAPFQTIKFAGTNVLPLGTEGLETDLKGKPKPVSLGVCFNVEPQNTNTSKLVFKCSGPVRDIPAVYDAGGLLAHGADYANEDEMIAVEPARGSFRVDKSTGSYRLGSTPAGQITNDVVDGLRPMQRTPASLFQRVLLDTGRDISDIDTGSVAVLNAKQKATLGVYIRDDTTIRAVLGDIARSAGAWTATNKQGKWKIERLEAPVGPGDIRLDDNNIDLGSLKRTAFNENAVPPWKTIVRCVPNYTIQSSGLLQMVRQARRNRLGQPYQDAEASNAAIKIAYLTSQERIIETKFACLLAGQEEAARQQALFGIGRESFECVVRGNAEFLGKIDLGKVAWVVSDEYNLQEGQFFRILGYQINATAGTASLTIWG